MDTVINHVEVVLVEQELLNLPEYPNSPPVLVVEDIPFIIPPATKISVECTITYN
jgi:hypothetical protein